MLWGAMGPVTRERSPLPDCLVPKIALKAVGALRAVLPAMTCSINSTGAEVCLATPAMSRALRHR
jgi:hypothetical protein